MPEAPAPGPTDPAPQAAGAPGFLGLAPGQGPLALAAGCASFLTLGSWYVLRPIREEIAANLPSGVDELWTAVFVAMLVASPLFGLLAKYTSRRALVSIAYVFFAAGTLGFSVALGHPSWEQSLPWFGSGELPPGARLASYFYVWCSVYTLFVVSVFWSVAVDLFEVGEARGLFGPIAAAGTLGGIASSFAVARVAGDTPVASLLRVPPLMLIGSLAALLWIERRLRAPGRRAVTPTTERIGGSLWSGLRAVFESPYLLAICGYMVLASALGSFLYQQQSYIVNAAFEDRGERRVFFANMNLAVNVGSLVSQLFLTRWLLARVGIGVTLSAVPLVACLGFAALGVGQLADATAAQLLWVFVAVQVLWRLTRYSFAKPTKELLFTLVPREQKYRAKNFIDTVVYRGGDAAGIQFAEALKGGLWIGVAVPLWGLALVAIPVGLGMLVLALSLGRRANERQRAA